MPDPVALAEALLHARRRPKAPLPDDLLSWLTVDPSGPAFARLLAAVALRAGPGRVEALLARAVADAEARPLGDDPVGEVAVNLAVALRGEVNGEGGAAYLMRLLGHLPYAPAPRIACGPPPRDRPGEEGPKRKPT